MLKNFSEAIALLDAHPSVTGVLLLDTEGLILGSSLSNQERSELLAPTYLSLMIDIYKHMNALDEIANQVCLVQSKQLVLIQPIYDIILVVYTEKKELDELQSKIKAAVSILKAIAQPEF
ncbi:hypothetical protein Ctha_2359 [Chloroherpeton thalassium ATCC 35110]|uniref:Roadblock/LAMTOR2 domain-containing protein n=2 Tax=Chloroherpeton thalassium TaxID=100716 RepID=B3QWP9_CHLT3|nr:hypothetical protein Ctha_2359 [Chloroherpeton thalassium ATCC 35110]